MPAKQMDECPHNNFFTYNVIFFCSTVIIVLVAFAKLNLITCCKRSDQSANLPLTIPPRKKPESLINQPKSKVNKSTTLRAIEWKKKHTLSQQTRTKSIEITKRIQTCFDFVNEIYDTHKHLNASRIGIEKYTVNKLIQLGYANIYNDYNEAIVLKIIILYTLVSVAVKQDLYSLDMPSQMILKAANQADQIRKILPSISNVILDNVDIKQVCQTVIHILSNHILNTAKIPTNKTQLKKYRIGCGILQMIVFGSRGSYGRDIIANNNFFANIIRLQESQGYSFDSSRVDLMRPLCGILILSAQCRSCDTYNDVDVHIQFTSCQQLSMIFCKLLNSSLHQSLYNFDRGYCSTEIDCGDQETSVFMLASLSLLLIEQEKKFQNCHGQYRFLDIILQLIKSEGILRLFVHFLEPIVLEDQIYMVRDSVLLTLQCLDNITRKYNFTDNSLKQRQLSVVESLLSLNVMYRLHHLIRLSHFTPGRETRLKDQQLWTNLLQLAGGYTNDFNLTSCKIISQIIDIYIRMGKCKEKLIKNILGHKIPSAVTAMLRQKRVKWPKSHIQDRMSQGIRLIGKIIDNCDGYQIQFMMSDQWNKKIVSLFCKMYFNRQIYDCNYRNMMQIFGHLVKIMDGIKSLPMQSCKRQHYKYLRFQVQECMAARYLLNKHALQTTRLKSKSAPYDVDYEVMITFMLFHHAMNLSKMKSVFASKYFDFCISAVEPSQFSLLSCFHYSLHLYKVCKNYQLSLYYTQIVLDMLEKNKNNLKMTTKMKYLRFKLVDKLGLNLYCHNTQCNKRFLFFKPKTCRACKSVFYCSKTCQKLHWKKYHARQCARCF